MNLTKLAEILHNAEAEALEADANKAQEEKKKKTKMGTRREVHENAERMPPSVKSENTLNR